jgi:hypothetical protein
VSYREYQASRMIAGQDYPFYALIMAAMRQADTGNMAKLRAAWPEVAAELQKRYNAPGGLLPDEARAALAAGLDQGVARARVVKEPGDPDTKLPTWAEMSDVDKGAALLHLHKRDWEGAEYAVENYPARYFDHPALVALSRSDACRHAVSVEDDAEAAGALRGDEYERLYDLALEAGDG